MNEIVRVEPGAHRGRIHFVDPDDHVPAVVQVREVQRSACHLGEEVGVLARTRPLQLEAAQLVVRSASACPGRHSLSEGPSPRFRYVVPQVELTRGTCAGASALPVRR